MQKTIVKELFIMMLLAFIIIITLRMVIFDFIPEEDTLPESIKYSTDAVVEETLREIDFDETKNNTVENYTEESILKSYIIEDSDLKHYVLKNKYKNNEVDPFEDYKEKNSNKKVNNR